MKIICIGRNYALHAKELGNEVPKEPVLFLKPDSSILQKNQPFFYPEFSKEIHHEVELVIKINRLGKHIPEKYAYKYYQEIGLGIDFTARDIQQLCKQKGLPWEKAKAFDGSAPLGKFIKKDKIKDINDIDFHLDVNGKTVQQGNSGKMIFSIDNIISHVSKFFTLKIGDLIFTGTPQGVGPVAINDHLQGYIQDKLMLDFMIK